MGVNEMLSGANNRCCRLKYYSQNKMLAEEIGWPLGLERDVYVKRKCSCAERSVCVIEMLLCVQIEWAVRACTTKL